MRTANLNPPRSHGRRPASPITPRRGCVLLRTASDRAYSGVVAARHAGRISDLPPHGPRHASRALPPRNGRAPPTTGMPGPRPGSASRAAHHPAIPYGRCAAVAPSHPPGVVLATHQPGPRRGNGSSATGAGTSSPTGWPSHFSGPGSRRLSFPKSGFAPGDLPTHSRCRVLARTG